MRITTCFLLFVVLGIAGCDRTYACSCACLGDYTVEQQIRDATVIVVAKVIKITDKGPVSIPGTDLVVFSSCGEQQVRVAVTQSLKGTAPTELSFVRSDVGTACDFEFPFREGDLYLLFGFGSSDGGTLQLSGCSPSLPAGKARKMIKTVQRQLAKAS